MKGHIDYWLGTYLLAMLGLAISIMLSLIPIWMFWLATWSLSLLALLLFNVSEIDEG